jgi:Leucine-rich repeat (LRR) protein
MITICGKEYKIDITELDLRHKSLTTIPEEIKYLTNLKSLNLSDNKITAIPEHIFDHLVNLESLYISTNQMTAIPEHLFDNLINLNKLTLFNNKIKDITAHMFHHLTNLHSLNLTNNQITAIPEHTFDKLINLKYLDLSVNKITALHEHIFDRLTTLQILYLYDNQITAIPISILNCIHLRSFHYHNNPIEHIDIRINRFISNMRTYDAQCLFNYSENIKESENVNSSVKDSINNLMRDTFTIDEGVMIKQLIEESPACLEDLLCYIDNINMHSTLYLTFFEVFVKVWGRIIGSEFKTDLIKRLDEEMVKSECKSFTGRISRLLNVLVGYFSDINIIDDLKDTCGKEFEGCRT